jgi:hypothetical protein
MVGRLIEVRRRYGMEIKVGKTKVMRISKQPSIGQIMTDERTTGECGIFQTSE